MNTQPRSLNTPQKLDPDQQFPVAQRMPLQVFVEESRGQKLSHWGPTVTAALSLILAAILGASAYIFNSRQIDLQKQQIDLSKTQTNLQTQQTIAQTEQVKAQLADLRFKFLNDLPNRDENKKIAAEIGLAGHGVDALPVVYFALGVGPGDIRDSAVNVVYRMFQAASFESRGKILEGLIREFHSPSVQLHTGIVQSLAKIEHLFNDPERELVIKKLNERFPPETACSSEEGRNLMKLAATFFPVKDPNSIPQLLRIVRCPRCGDGWFLAMFRLQNLARTTAKLREPRLAAEVEQIKGNTLKNLRQSVTDEDLESGGFQEFIPAGQESIKFDDFKKRVTSEFQQLKEILNQK